jgi:2-polyprenyl-3-methyl-5-hydroxy-6-metoxy-1,4-benzoquinol methylase
VALARFLAETGDMTGLDVMELGCGPGLPGITAGLLGARVLLTDCVPSALGMALDHARMNGLTSNRVGGTLLDWEFPCDLPSFDLVMGAEILYDYFYHGSLVGLLRRVVRPNGVILLADRKRLVVSRFIGRMLDGGFSCSERVVRVDLQGLPRQTVSVFRLVRSGEGTAVSDQGAFPTDRRAIR